MFSKMCKEVGLSPSLGIEWGLKTKMNVKKISKPFTCAVVGASGMVGGMFIKLLEKKSENLPIKKMYLFASSRSAGTTMNWNNELITVEELNENSFVGRGIDVVLFGAGSTASKSFVPLAVKAGCVVIDNASYWRMDEDVPLIVPEVNKDALFNHKGIIANPNCCAVPAVMALNPLLDNYGLKRVVISTYQAVSGGGIKGMHDLEKTLNGQKPDFFPHAIAYNVIPHIDIFDEDGYTGEEIKVMNEVRKVLQLPNLAITSTNVRVPVQNGHSLSINVELERPFELDDVREIIKNTPSMILHDEPEKNIYPMPIIAAGTDDVYVGRLRYDRSCENGLNMWVCADNTRKGAATNAIQILESLIEHENGAIL